MIKSTHLSHDIVRLCSAFADRSLRSNVDAYGRRRQTNPSKIHKDILTGKLAEFGVYFIYLDLMYPDVTPPDLRVYSKEDKTYDADLYCGEYSIHVKSQTLESVDLYGHSWLFQYEDPLFVRSSKHDIVIGCTVDLDKSGDGCYVEVQLEKAFPSLVFGKPKLQKFSGGKKALYLKDNNDQG